MFIDYGVDEFIERLSRFNKAIVQALWVDPAEIRNKISYVESSKKFGEFLQDFYEFILTLHCTCPKRSSINDVHCQFKHSLPDIHDSSQLRGDMSNGRVYLVSN